MKEKLKQLNLFNLDEIEEWRKEWQDMPEFIQEDLQPFRTITVHFETMEDLEKFSKLTNQKITHLTKSIWFPEMTLEKLKNKRYVDENK